MSAREQRGFAIVEFALCAPLLLVLLLATAELGRALTQYSRLSHSVRDAVRYVADSVFPDSTGVMKLTAPVIATAKNLVVYAKVSGSGTPVVPGLTPGQVAITSSAATGEVVVSVTYPYQSLLGGTIPMLGYGGDRGTTFNLVISSTMRGL